VPDRPLPDATGDVDHILVGPDRVWVIDAERWHHCTRIHRSSARRGDRPLATPSRCGSGVPRRATVARRAVRPP